MASRGWLWDAARRAFKAIGERFLGRRQLVGVRDTALDAAAAQMRDLAARTVRGEATTGAFRAGMRDLIRNAHGSAYLAGRGGLDAMARSDVRTLSALLRSHDGHLDRFVRDLEAGRLTEAQAGARAELYAGAGSFERGRGAAWGIRGLLPLYPGDNCEGGPRCRCSWSMVETDDAIECTWRLGGSKPCGPCRDNAAAYSPYTIAKSDAAPDTTPVRLSAAKRATEATTA